MRIVRDTFDVATIIETTNADMPTEVYNAISELWIDYEFGNDVYYFKTSIVELEQMVEDEGDYLDYDLSVVPKWLLEIGFDEHEILLLHHWW